MTKRGDESYSPKRRTALVLSGVGTAGAYHAGVLRALHEAGVKLDVVAGRGAGAIGALFAAIDGSQRLWEEGGFWRSPAVAHLYAWRPLVRLAATAALLAVAIVLVPLAVVAAGLVVFPIDFLLKMLGGGAGGLVARYDAFAQAAFAPGALPTWLPRLVVLVLGSAAAVIAVDAWMHRGTRHVWGRMWWRMLRPPLATAAVVDRVWSVLWDLVRGAAQVKQPSTIELSRRYVELLTDNLGQPGFRDLLIAAHDVDAHADVVFALVAEPRRRDLLRRQTTGESEARRSGVVDLSGIGWEHVADALAGALTVPLAAECHTIVFSPDSYWRGESHRLCDRPACLLRLVEELDALGVEQVILASAAPVSPKPHQLDRPRLEGRARIGEYLHSSETAVVRDVLSTPREGRARIFTIQPEHNAIGPFDFRGGFDDRSDRHQPLGELLARGYEDAYHQFIEPILGASGDRVGAP